MWAYGIVWYEILCWLFHEEGFAWRYLEVEEESLWFYYRTDYDMGWPVNMKLLRAIKLELASGVVRAAIRIVERAPLPDEV